MGLKWVQEISPVEELAYDSIEIDEVLEKNRDELRELPVELLFAESRKELITLIGGRMVFGLLHSLFCKVYKSYSEIYGRMIQGEPGEFMAAKKYYKSIRKKD